MKSQVKPKIVLFDAGPPPLELPAEEHNRHVMAIYGRTCESARPDRWPADIASTLKPALQRLRNQARAR